MDFSGQVALVTGGAGGIGSATAKGFAERGAKVAVVDADLDGAKAVADAIGGAGGIAIAIHADVTSSASVKAYVDKTVGEFGTIDCFFNNAGIVGKICPTAEYDEAVFDAVIGVNVKGVFLGLRHVLPVMIAKGSGAIVNTASVAGLVGTPGMPAYCASKHAVLGITKTVSGEVARQGIRVNAVCPGPVQTSMIETVQREINAAEPDVVKQRYQDSIPTGRYSLPEEIAMNVLYLCSDLAANITGTHLTIDGGRTATGGAVTRVANT
jgi:NAD(P)-dependent dehydrogenase (short-subunit alcohol dehydrogenase family)